MKGARHPCDLSGPERSASGFTSAEVDRSGALSWFNTRQKHAAGAVPSAMAQALTAALQKVGIPHKEVGDALPMNPEPSQSAGARK